MTRDDYRFFKTVKNGSNFKEFNRIEFQDFRFLTVFRLVKDFFFLNHFQLKTVRRSLNILCSAVTMATSWKQERLYDPLDEN